MKKLILLISLTFLICLLPMWAGAGTTYYCDLDDAGTGSAGTFADPFSYADVLSKSDWATGDDLYFKAGTDVTISYKLRVYWSGTSGDRVVIGAYDGEGDFDITGSSRPELDGNFTAPGDWTPIIDIDGEYVTVQDIKCSNSYGRGILAEETNNIIIQRCYVYKARRKGIQFTRVDTGVVDSNIVEWAEYSTTPGAGIEITATDSEDATTNIIIKRNKVFHCYEGIGIYRKATYCTAEYNVVYDNRSYQIYIANASHNTMRYNLVYHSSEYNSWGGGSVRVPGLVIDNESALGYSFTDDNDIYGNLVAACSHGIKLTCHYIANTNVNVFNNTIVDCDYNFHFNYDSLFSNMVVSNNLSYTLDASSYHSNNYSPSNVTWSYNLWDDTISGDASSGTGTVNNGTPNLNKTSGWRSLTAGSVDGSDFALADDTGDADDAGTGLGSPYNIGIYETGTDLSATPPTIVTGSYGTADIGAIVYEGSPPAGCSEWYDASVTVDKGLNIGAYNGWEYTGLRWIQPSNQDVCKVDVYVNNIAGTLGVNHDYYMRIFTVDGNNDLDTVVGTSSKIDGDSLVAATWTSANAGYFEFDPPLTLSASGDYGITIFPDQDGNQSDDPEHDGTNFWQWGYDEANNSAANQEGMYYWAHGDGTMPFADTGSDAVDDMQFKIFTGTTPTSPTCTDICICTISGGAITAVDCADSSTWTNGTYYIGVAVSEQLIVLGNPDQSVLKLSPDFGTMVGKYYDHLSYSSTWYIVYEFRVGYTWNIATNTWDTAKGQRDTALQTAAVGVAIDLDDGEGTATFEDGDSNSLDTTLPDTNVASIVVANPKDGNSPFEIKASGGDGTSRAGLLALIDHFVTGDNIHIFATTEDQTWTSSNITIRYRGSLTGDLSVTGDNNYIYNSSRYVSGSRGDTGSGNTWLIDGHGWQQSIGLGCGMGPRHRASDTP